MASKREFKKAVESLGAGLCQEMMTAYYNIDNVDRNVVAAAIEKVLAAVSKAKDNSNVYFDKGHKAFDSHMAYSKAKEEFFKSLFNKIDSEFASELNAALKMFNSALPAEVKEQNKEAVAE